REVANKARAEETIKSAIVSDPQKLKQALETGEISLDMTSISLVTPDSFRGFSLKKSDKISKSNEKAMLAEQLKAWKEFDGKETTIMLKDKDGNDKPVKVKSDIIAFNFGV